MSINKLKVVLTEEAQAFLYAQPFKAQQKIYHNIFKVEEGVMKVDIFKKLETSVITLPTMSRVFQALGIATATLDLGIAGKIALW